MTPEELLQRAEAQARRGVWEAAASDCVRAAQLAIPGTPMRQRATEELARVSIVLGRWEEARSALALAQAFNPSSALALTLQGLVDEAEGKLERAIERHAQAIGLAPVLGLAHYNLGRAQTQLARWREAISSLQRACDLEPQVTAYRHALAVALHGAGETALSMRALTECLRQDPSFYPAWLALADLLALADHPDLADSLLEQAAALFPKQGLPHSKRAALAIRRGELSAVREHLTRQCAATPNSEDPLLARAQVHVLERDLEQAEADLKRALALNPSSSAAYYQLGVLYDGCGLKQPAEDAYRNAIRHDSSHWRARNNLGVMLLEAKQAERWQEAQGLLEDACAACPPALRHQPQFNLALAHCKLGHQLEAISCAEQAAAAEGDDPVIQSARRLADGLRTAAP